MYPLQTSFRVAYLTQCTVARFDSQVLNERITLKFKILNRKLYISCTYGSLYERKSISILVIDATASLNENHLVKIHADYHGTTVSI